MEQGLNDTPSTRKAIWWTVLLVLLAGGVALALVLDGPDPAPTPRATTTTTETSLIAPVSIEATTTTAPPPPPTTEPPRTTTTKVSRGVPRTPPPLTEPPPVDGDTRTIGSSAYCLRGNMANGAPVHDGVVASTILPQGSSWRIVKGKLEGKVLTVEDTGGRRATFDVWMASCSAAMAYGRPTLVIQRVG